ncbi:alpha/beta hydrolase [uncultured Litoreibacter sp.]|uniref:alpha/beta hydrolase n=1 Tax=uncultured Litoreibacter sp. TaxID=1392394 RepID=UPI0026169404|nr:alpha/beta hydrolase [uncultured Litoreibacter sp.]
MQSINEIFDHVTPPAKDKTPITTCKTDPRFSYTFYIPPTLSPKTSLLTVIHGNMRSVERTRDAFVDFARWNDCVIMAPLFPLGVLGDDNKDGFKFIQEGDIRYDLLLLEMFAEARAKFGLETEQMGIFGFAGGAQFAQRFTLLHPHKVKAASISAPGSVTLLDPDKDWWIGIGDTKERFGIEVDVDALAKVAFQLVVGTADVDPGTNETSASWIPGGRIAGETAHERVRSLEASLNDNNIKVQVDLVSRKGHELLDLVLPSKLFFKEALAH